MEEYPLFKKSISMAFFTYVITIFFWRSFVASFCLASLPLIVGMVLRKDETPVFSMALGFQWLQVSIGIIARDIFANPLSAVDHPRIDLACYLGIINIIVLAIGIRLGYSLIKKVKAIDYIEEIKGTPYSLKKIFLAYFIVVITAPPILMLSMRHIQFGTILRAIVAVQHFLLFILFTISLLYNSFYYIGIALILEIVYGISGYFSGYKSAILILIMAAALGKKGVNIKRGAIISSSLVLLFLLSMIWTGIKSSLRAEYNIERFREFTISGEKLDFVYRLGEEFIKQDRGLYERGTMDSLVERISSLYYFACTLEMVPFWIPHENGKLFFATIKHLLTPRLLFFRKEPLPPDSWMVRKYADAMVAGEEEKTCIGLGYPAENYIDFGIPGMFLPTLLLGILGGILYRHIFRVAANTLLANALATAIFFFSYYLFETANIKLWGGLIGSYIIVMALFAFYQRKILAYIRSGPL